MSILPPQNREVEQALLSLAIINNHSCYSMLSKLDADDFYFVKHTHIYNAIKHLIENEISIGLVSIKTRLQEIREFDQDTLMEVMQSSAISSEADYFINIIKDLSVRRKLILKNTDSIKSLYDTNIPLEDITKSIMSELILTEVTQDVCETQEIMSLEDMRKSENMVFVKTGYALDEYINGLANGNLIVLAGRPGDGKTSLALNIAENIAGRVIKPGERVLINSAEMTREELKIRVISRYTHIAFMHLLEGSFSSEQLVLIDEAEKYFNSLDVVINDNVDDIDDIVLLTHRLNKEKPLKLVVTDYLQLLDNTLKGSTNEKVNDISRKCKRLAKKIRCPHLALSQFSRAVEKENRLPMLSDLRDSGGIEQNADVVLFICNPIFEDSNEWTAEEQIVNWKKQSKQEKDLIIAKCRNGDTGSVPVFFWKARTEFVD